MTDDNMNDFDDDLDTTSGDEDDSYGLSDNDNTSHVSRLSRRQQIEQLLEEKRLFQELDSYDEYLSRKSNDFDDDSYYG